MSHQNLIIRIEALGKISRLLFNKKNINKILNFHEGRRQDENRYLIASICLQRPRHIFAFRSTHKSFALLIAGERHKFKLVKPFYSICLIFVLITFASTLFLSSSPLQS